MERVTLEDAKGYHNGARKNHRSVTKNFHDKSSWDLNTDDRDVLNVFNLLTIPIDDTIDEKADTAEDKYESFIRNVQVLPSKRQNLAPQVLPIVALIILRRL